MDGMKTGDRYTLQFLSVKKKNKKRETKFVKKTKKNEIYRYGIIDL